MRLLEFIGPKAFKRGSKTKKWQIEAKPTWHLFWKENQSVQTKRTVLKRELLIWRTKNQAMDQGTVQLKDFNLLQISPNWFLGNWTLDPGPSSKAGLRTLLVKIKYIIPIYLWMRKTYMLDFTLNYKCMFSE